MIIYIAGPYQHPDPVSNTRRAIESAEEVLKKGHTPYVPHLNLLWEMVAHHDPSFWYAYDIVFLKKCDALLRIPGDSFGADREVDLMKAWELPVYYSIEEVPSVS